MKLSGIALPFWDCLHRLGADDAVPRQAGAGLAANLAEHRGRVAVMMEEFDSLNRRFEFAGIEYAVWKGFALIPDYCPDAGLRPSYDYDYLISEETHARAQEALEAAGYVLKPGRGPQHHVTFVPPQLSSRHSPSAGGLFSASLPRKVELHLRLWDEEAFGISLRVPECPLQRKSRRNWQGLSFYALPEEDAFVFQTLHAFQHILHNWCRLGWLRDIAYFLEQRSTDTPFWKELFAHLEANEPLAEVVALVISLAAGVFHAGLPASMKNWLRGAMRSQVSLWVDQYGLRSAIDNFSENKYTLFLYREFVRDEAAWRQIRRSRLLPLQRPNRLPGAAAPATSVPLPESWKQAWYVIRRLVHHSMRGAGYVWESARWERLRRLSDGRV
jgi:hypothetical protein